MDTAVDILEEALPVEKSAGTCAQGFGATGGANGGVYKIAVATDENRNVFGHFGSCKTFTVYSMENGKLVGKSILEN